MHSQNDPFNEYNSLSICKSIETKLRKQITLLQVVPDELRNYNIIFVTKENQVFAFGDNTNGCLGVGHDNPILDEAKQIKELQGKHVIQICTGNRFVMVRTRFGELFSWGTNTNGQLAQLDEFRKTSIMVPAKVELPFAKSIAVKHVCVGYAFGAILTSDGKVYAFGQNDFGQCGTGDRDDREDLNQIFELDPVRQIGCGAKHLVMLSCCNTKMYVCGSNDMGQLGLNCTLKTVPAVLKVPIKSGETIRAVACGYAHTLVLLSNGMILGFGDNRQGSLGTSSNGSNNICDPHLIQEDEIFERLYTNSLSNISVAKSASSKDRLYVWGPVKDKNAYKVEQFDQSTQKEAMLEGAINNQTQSNNNKNLTKVPTIISRPRRAYITSVAKLFAVYEPNCLTFSDQLSSEGVGKFSEVTL